MNVRVRVSVSVMVRVTVKPVRMPRTLTDSRSGPLMS